MSKTIRVSDETYDSLVENMRPRESFDTVIARLLSFYNLPLVEIERRYHGGQTMEAQGTKDSEAARRE